MGERYQAQNVLSTGDKEWRNDKIRLNPTLRLISSWTKLDKWAWVSMNHEKIDTQINTMVRNWFWIHFSKRRPTREVAKSSALPYSSSWLAAPFIFWACHMVNCIASAGGSPSDSEKYFGHCSVTNPRSLPRLPAQRGRGWDDPTTPHHMLNSCKLWLCDWLYQSSWIRSRLDDFGQF